MHIQRKTKSVTKLFKKHAEPLPRQVGLATALFFVTHGIKTILAGKGYGRRILTACFLQPFRESCRSNKKSTFGVDRLVGVIRNLFRSCSSGVAVSERSSFSPITELKQSYQQPSTSLPARVFRNCRLPITSHRDHQDQYVRKRRLGDHYRNGPMESVTFLGQVIATRAAICPSPLPCRALRFNTISRNWLLSYDGEQ